MAGGMGKVEYEQLKEFQKTFESAVDEITAGKVYNEALKEIGRVHLGNCISNTPFGMYPTQVSFIAYRGTPKEKVVSFTVTPKLGGTLKKGWVVKSHSQAENSKGIPTQEEINSTVNGTPIIRTGKHRQMTFFNRVNYANYVDKGHRICRPKGNQIGWVKPQNFIRNSENETARQMPGILEKHMRKALEGRTN